jgi:guanylate kinase
MVAEGELLEWAVVHGRRYGTPRSRSRRRWRGRPAMLEIDLQGARQVRETMPGGAVRLPGAAVVGGAGPPAGRPRAPRRGGAGARLATAREELAAEPEFDVTIVNTKFTLPRRSW